MAKTRLTVRKTFRTGIFLIFKKVGHSDPVIPNGRIIAQRIKGTPGITGWYPLRVHIDEGVWHLYVVLAYPGGEAAPKGSAVRRLKCYMKWV